MFGANKEKMVRRLAEEYEAATLNSRGAIDQGDWEQKYIAIKRFYLVYKRIHGLTFDQKMKIDRILLERGRIAMSDTKAIIETMEEMARELAARDAAEDHRARAPLH